MSMQICFPVIDEETGNTASVCVPLAHIPIEKMLEQEWPRPHFKVDKDFDALFDPFVNPEGI